MARGRRRQPDELKALKGNPGKRKLLLGKGGRDPETFADGALQIAPLVFPDFLTQPRERRLFKNLVEDYLRRRIARPADFNAYARYCSYLDRWITCKEALDGEATYFKSETKHGEFLRRHPLFKDLLDLERALQTLEDRLGLNPVARQSIIRGMAAIPMGAPISADGAEGDEQAPASEQPKPAADEPQRVSPLGFLQGFGKKLN